jgi:hypothetical protein
MQPLKAHGRKGRLVLDEPTDLPEGKEVELVPLDEVLARAATTLTRTSASGCTIRSVKA